MLLLMGAKVDKDLESHLSYLHSFVFPQDIVSLRKKGGGQIPVVSDGTHVSSESSKKHSGVHSYARSEWEDWRHMHEHRIHPENMQPADEQGGCTPCNRHTALHAHQDAAPQTQHTRKDAKSHTGA